jgi:hypothetical protein
MTPEQAVYLSNRALEVLENEAYVNAFVAIEEELILQWKNSPARDADGREKLWLMLAMLQKVQNCLQATLDGGKLAKKELEHRQTLKDRAKSLVSWMN